MVANPRLCHMSTCSNRLANEINDNTSQGVDYAAKWSRLLDYAAKWSRILDYAT
jgi:hypothetical protein